MLATDIKRKPRWLEPCAQCGKKHLYEIGLCPECGVYEVPRLVSEKACYTDEACDGCFAYRDHLR